MITTLLKKNIIVKSKLKLLLGYIFLPFIIIKFKKKVSKCKNWEEYIDLAYKFQFQVFKKPIFKVGILPLQFKGELIRYLKLINHFNPKIIFECGTAHGGNLFLMARFSNKNTILISVDLPGGISGEGYPSWKIPFYKSFAAYNQKIFLIRADSHKLSTYKKVEKILKNEKIDVAFIDADHTYNGVKRDFELYRNLINSKGIMIFHDIVPSKNKNVGVPKFWKEIQNKYKYKEIINSNFQNCAGVGVLYITD